MSDVFDDLSGVQLGDATITQLDSVASKSYVDRSNRRHWMSLQDLALAIANSRTYSHGLPIPEAGAVSNQAVGDSVNETLKPSGTELWLIQAIEAVADTTSSSVILNLFDGTNTAQLTTITADTNGVTFHPKIPIYLSNSLYLAIQNAGDSITLRIAYQKVGL